MQRTAPRISQRVIAAPWWGRLRQRLNGRLALLCAFASVSVINYLFGIAGGWLLLSGDFGLVAFGQTLLLVGGLVLSSGFASSLSATLVKTPAPRHAALVGGAVVANGALALLMSAALLLLFGAGPLRDGLETWPVALAVSGALLPISMVAIARAAAQGTGRFGVAAVLTVLEVGGKAASGVGLMLAGWGALGALLGFLLGGLVAFVPAVWFLASRSLVRVRGAELPSARPVAGMFGALLGSALLLNLDIVALKLLSSNRDAIGHYQAAIVLANTPYYLHAAMLPAFFVQMARHDTLRGTRPVVAEVARLALVFLVPVEIALALFPHMFLDWLFPAAYQASAAVLPVLALGNCAILVVATLSAAFQATGRAARAARIILAVVGGEALVLALVVPRMEAGGAAATFAGASAVAAVCLGVAYWHGIRGETVGKER